LHNKSMNPRLALLDPNKPDERFPAASDALTVPDGLLAVGGCLSETRLLNAYRQGIFPWYSPNEPILWWSPNPRLVLFPDNLQVSRSLQKTLRKQNFKITLDKAFKEVMMACAGVRNHEQGTWISEDIREAYLKLFKSGYAHSCEVWDNGELVGGLYGVALGRVFFGESMFYRQRDASKIAFVYLVRLLEGWGYCVIDCQVTTRHLMSLGAEEISRERFIALLDDYCRDAPADSAWQIA
jgi:leucyl/phenylalanyl-tRNA---protein transferase